MPLFKSSMIRAQSSWGERGAGGATDGEKRTRLDMFVCRVVYRDYIQDYSFVCLRWQRREMVLLLPCRERDDCDSESEKSGRLYVPFSVGVPF